MNFRGGKYVDSHLVDPILICLEPKPKICEEQNEATSST